MNASTSAVRTAREMSIAGRLALLAFVFLTPIALFANTASAQVTWDANTGTSAPQDGSGTWSTSNANWWDGSANVVWPNLTTSSAIIGANSGAAGTITVSGSLALNSLTFNAPGSGSYTLTGGTLGFGGTTPTITVNTAVGTISSVLAGSAGLTKSGTGTLILTGVNTYTGTTTVSGGTLQIGNGGALATIASTPIVNNGNVFYNMNSAGASFTVAPMTGSGNLTATTGGQGNGYIRLGGNITLSGSVSISSGVGSGAGQNGIRQSGNTTITASAISLNGNFGSAGNDSNFVLTLDTSAGNGPISIDAYNGMGGHTWAGVSTVIANAGTGAVNIAGAQAGKAGVGSWSATLTGALNISSSYSPGALTLNATAGSSITGNLALTVNSANVWTVSPGVTMAVSGALSGSNAAITKNGTGLLTFTGNNTYTGTTTINSGTLQIGTGSTAGSLSGSTAITGSAGGVLAFNRSDNYGGNVSNTIGGGVGLTLSAGTLALTGSNSYTGPTTINAGVLSLGNAAAIGSTGTISFGGGVLQFTGANSTDYSSRFSTGTSQTYALDTNGQNVTVGTALTSSGGSLRKLGSGTLTLSAANTYTGTTTISAGALQIGNGSTSGSLSGSTAITGSAGGVLVFSRSDNYGGNFANSIGGGLGLTLSTGTLTLTGVNTYTGTTTINAGATLGSGTGGTAGSLPTSAIVNNGNLSYNLATDGSTTVSLPAGITGSGNLSVNGGRIQFNGNITQGGTQTYTQTGAWPNSMRMTANTTLTGSAITMSGLLGQDGNNSFIMSLDTSVANGPITLALTIGQTGRYYGINAFTVNSGTGTLSMTGNPAAWGVNTTTLTGALNIASALSPAPANTGSTTALNLNATAASSVTGNMTFGENSTNTWTVNPGVTMAVSGRLAGTAAAITKSGSGTLTLSGSNSYTGATTINAGVVALSGSGILASTGTVAIAGSGATFDISGANGNRTIGTLTGVAGSIVTLGSNSLMFGDATSGTFAGNISGSGAFTKVGSGTFTLAGTLGVPTLNLNAGAVVLGSSGRLTSSTVAVTGSSGASLTLGGNESFGSLAGAANIGLGSATLSVGGANTSTTYSGNLTGSGIFAKVGSGTLTLSGNNSYSGGSQIAAGALRLGSSTALPSSSAVTLGTGSTSATLDFNTNTATLGSITFNGSGSQLSPGGKLNLLAGGTNAATIRVSTGSHALHPDTTLQSDAVIDVASGALFTLHGVIDGTKALTKIGSGTLAIYGANSYAGGSYLSGGYVSALSSGALGSGTVTIGNATTLNLNNTILTNTVVFSSGSGAIINSGTFVNVTGTYAITSGTGSTITTSYNVLSGGDISFVNNLASTVQVQSGAQGTFTADVLAGTPAASVFVNAGGRGTFSGSVLGDVTTSGSSLFSGSVAGNVTVGGGTATFSGPTTADSAVNVNGGLAVFTGTVGGIAHATASGATIEIRDRVLSTADVNAEAGGIVKLMGSQAFDATTIDNGGSVIVDRTANLALAAVISGSGSLTKSDSLTLTLTGNNTYSGLTTISGGTLSVGNGGASGALAGNVLNNAALIFNRSDDSTYAGNISGSGGVTKLGAGKLTLTGSQSFAGPTTVGAGTLAVNGQLGGNVAVAGGAFLGGSGSVAGVLSGAGIVSPGNSPGILTAGQFDPTAGLGAAFEFRGVSPLYTNSTASVNDVLRLTNSAAFTSTLGGSNVINVYFDMDSIARGDVFEGGFFTTLSAADLLTAVQGAAFQYWAKDSGGSTVFNGVNYSSLTSLPGLTGVTLTTASVTRDFGGGAVSGSVTQFIIVPEPGAVALAGIGVAMAGWALVRGQRSRRAEMHATTTTAVGP